MANRIFEHEVPWRRQPASTRLYPWHDWFDGSTWLLTEDDFDGAMPAFRARLYYMAREMGYRLRTRLQPDGLYIQALAADGSPLGPVS